MEKRYLGRSGLRVAPVILGGNVFGWNVNETESFRILDAFVDSGLDAIDTADIYSSWVPGNDGGESETIIGRWMQSRKVRSRIVLATKLAKPMGPNQSGLSANYMVKAVEASLKRLQTDVIDLYQSHEDDTQTSFEESMTAFDRLIKAGKVRAIGASNYGAARFEASLNSSQRLGVARYEVMQPHYNLYHRADYEQGLEPVCLQHGIGVIPYYSLASGFLTGKYRSSADAYRSVRGGGIVNEFLNPRGFRILKALDQVSAELRHTQAEVALAWLLHRPSVTAPIASATRVDQIGTLARAASLKLSPAQLQVLEGASRV